MIQCQQTTFHIASRHSYHYIHYILYFSFTCVDYVDTICVLEDIGQTCSMAQNVYPGLIYWQQVEADDLGISPKVWVQISDQTLNLKFICLTSFIT